MCFRNFNRRNFLFADMLRQGYCRKECKIAHSALHGRKTNAESSTLPRVQSLTASSWPDLASISLLRSAIGTFLWPVLPIGEAQWRRAEAAALLRRGQPACAGSGDSCLRRERSQASSSFLPNAAAGIALL